MWDTASLRQVATPLPLDFGASDARARFDADGRLVVVSGSTMRVFTVDTADWLARACAVAGRPLTEDDWSEVLPTRPYAPACAAST